MQARNVSIIYSLGMFFLLLIGPGFFFQTTVFAAEKKATEENPTQGWRESITGMDFVLVKGACFQMGCGSWTSECASDEKPVHEVCIDTFWMGKYEVTQGQWQKVMGDNPSFFKQGDNYPVEMVSWDDAQDFIQKMNAKSGRSFRLPTEAEWEYAARSGGKEEKFSGGNDFNGFSWCSFNSEEKPHAVGGKTFNGLGLYDMSGNVSEWVQDWFDSDYYSRSPRRNPQGATSGPGRVYRGGCWGNVPGFLRVAARNWNTPDTRSETIGFRLVLPENK